MYNSILHCALVLHIVGACVKQKTLICASRQRFLHQVVDKEEVCLWRQSHRQGLWNSGGLWLYGLSGGTVTTLKKKSVHELQLLFFLAGLSSFTLVQDLKRKNEKRQVCMSSVAFERGRISDFVLRQMDLISRYVALVKREKRSSNH